MTTQSLRDKFLTVEADLCDQFVGRNQEIRGLMLAALAKHHVLLLGPPGTAKSQLANLWAKALGVGFFRRLITQHSTPDELFGPIDIKAYKDEGIFRRILKGKAADREIVYLDEVFKGGPTILNTLLTLMEERIVDNDGDTHLAPLISMIGTSNEIPASDDNLDAFYDRFMLRYLTHYLDDDDEFKQLMTIPTPELHADSISGTDLMEAQQEVEDMEPSPTCLDSYHVLWETFRGEDITISDRRFKVSMKIAAAESWLKGFEEVRAESLVILQHVLWSKPEEFNQVKRIVLGSVNPSASRATEILEAAKEACESPLDDEAEVVQLLAQIRAMKEELRQLPVQDDTVKAVFEKVNVLQQDLMNKLAGD